MEQTFQLVVKAYRAKQGLTVRSFADALNQKLINTSISHGAISRWETEENVSPDLNIFFEMLVTYTDWRHQFAIDSIKSIMPHVFETGMMTFRIPKHTHNSAETQA